MSILVIAEHDHRQLKSSTLNTLTAALSLGDDVHLLVAGHECAPAAQAGAALAAVRRVLVADAAAYADQTAESLALLIVAQAAAYSHILLPGSTFGKNLAPRIAALLDVAQISDIIAVESADTFQRPIYAGNAIATVQSRDAIKVLTVRCSAFAAASGAGAGAPVETLSPLPVAEGSRVLSRE
ncbi:MAG: electron transfer flavoprotein subunit alpha/FixB family protein, partial [Zoogloea sp.]